LVDVGWFDGYWLDPDDDDLDPDGVDDVEEGVVAGLVGQVVLPPRWLAAGVVVVDAEPED
jgi:hypothetical protein